MTMSGGESGRLPGEPGHDRSGRIALALLLFTLAVRPCLPETVSFETPSWTRNLDVPAGPMPATTLALSGVVFVALALAVAGRVRRGLPVFSSRVGAAGGLLLLIAAGLSAWQAGQKHLAVSGAISFLGCVATLPALAFVLTSPARIRLTACVMLATGAVVAARCMYQVAVDFPDTRAYFEEHRAEYEAMAGEEGRGRFFDFEKRLESNSATGYFSHSNVAASYLICVVMVALAVVCDRWRRGKGAALAAPGAVVVIAVAGLYFCRSKGGWVALALGIAVCIAGLVRGAWFARHARRAVIAFWVAAAVGAVGVVALGVSRGGLPGLSMLYRWQYWRGAAGIVRDQGWLGIGSDNFGRFFTRFKPVECPEEVSDPHSWIVRLLVEWGALGLVGFVAVLVGASQRVARRPAASLIGVGADEPIIPWVFLVGAGMFLAWWAIYADGALGFLLLLLGMPILLWFPAAWLLSVEPGHVREYRTDAADRMLPALVGGAIAFLVHTAIDLGMFAPGAACSFFAVIGMAIAVRGSGAERAGRRRTRLADGMLVATAVAGLGYLVLVVRPASICAEQLGKARQLSGPATWDGFVRSSQFGAYAAAAEADRADATAANEVVQQLLRRIASAEQADQALAWIEQIRRRDPRNPAADRDAAALFAIRSGLTRDAGDLRRAAEAMRRAVAAYPTSPSARLLLAELLVRLNAVSPSAETAEEAARELEAALKLDEQQIYISKPHRLSEERRASIAAEIRRLRAGQPSSAATKSS